MDVAIALLAWAAIVVISMLAVGYLAARWGRDPFGWLLMAAAAGPFAIIGLVGTRQRDVQHPEALERGERAHAGGKVVIVGCDGSEQSTRAARYAAREYADADEFLLMVVLPREGRPSAGDDVARGEHDRRVEASTRDALSEIRGSGLNARVVVGYGVAGEEIARAAQSEQATAVVMGKRGAGLSRALIGSTSEHVLKHAPAPVVVVD